MITSNVPKWYRGGAMLIEILKSILMQVRQVLVLLMIASQLQAIVLLLGKPCNLEIKKSVVARICEGIWLQKLLGEQKIPTVEPMKVMCDNLATIIIAKNLIHHDRFKHVELDQQLIKEKVESGFVKLVHSPRLFQIADVLTKALYRIRFEELKSKLVIINIYSHLRGSFVIHI